MAKKVKSKGAYVPPKFRGFIALLLSLCIVFFSFPFSASAGQSLNFYKIYCRAVAKNMYKVEQTITYGSNFTGNIQNKDLSSVYYNFNFAARNFKAGDSVSFNLSDFVPVWVASCDVEIKCYNFIYTSDTDASGNMYAKFYRTDYSSTSSVDVPIYTFNDDCKGYFEVYFTFDNFKIKNTYENDDFYYNIKINSDVSSESSSLLNKIIDFVKGIFENLKELPSKIGDFFTNLSNSLKQWFADVGDWFSNLGDNLKQWFANVGDWFSSLGEKIGGFFTDIFDKIKEFFTSLFKPHDGYFDEVRNDLDAYLAAHLGIAYTAIPAILEFTKRIFTDVSNAYQGSPIITLPAINIPIGANTIHLLDPVSVNLDDYMTTDENMQNVLTIFFGISDTLLNVGAFICFCRVVYKKFVNKVGVEGGDDV